MLFDNKKRVVFDIFIFRNFLFPSRSRLNNKYLSLSFDTSPPWLSGRAQEVEFIRNVNRRKFKRDFQSNRSKILIKTLHKSV